MRKTISAAIAFLAILLVASYLQAQSGRTRGQSAPATTPANKTETKTADGDDTEGVNNVDGPPEIIEGDVLRVDTSLVTVPVSVMDRYGKYIPNLRRQDFRLFDQGIEQKISYFATVDTPFTVVFVLDTSSSTHFKLEDMHNAAISFVNQLQPQDSVMVVSFDDNIRVLTEPTSDREALMKAIRRAKTGGSTRLYDAVEMVIRKMLRAISGRKAIVLSPTELIPPAGQPVTPAPYGKPRNRTGLFTLSRMTLSRCSWWWGIPWERWPRWNHD